jgi:CRISPR-associated endonuclease/helicase Cas3
VATSEANGKTQAIAHVARLKDGGWREPHDLAEHLRAVAKLAAEHAQPFGGEDWARLAGRWHDLGKYRSRFQRYIRRASGYEVDAHIEGSPGRVTHSTAGALLACDRFQQNGRVLAYLIAGHHAGLDDWHGGLEARLASSDARTELEEVLAAQPSTDVLEPGHFLPKLNEVPGGRAGFALWVRMLFSCLVDADFLDTEAYLDPERGTQRGLWPEIDALLDDFDRYMEGLISEVEPTCVNRLRADVLAQCCAKADDAPGLFSLTVPTGGGKTLASMAFALKHAKRYDKRRVIYVIPYMSIIEQTADVFRSIFGEAVIEHHSQAEALPAEENARSRLACENWDAPIIVTTNVQFFESLFAVRTSRCRKLHNIVNSVVVLDEAQLLPVQLLQPLLDVLNLLKQHYGVTVVLCTATQPALATRAYFDQRQNLRGLDDVREIIRDPDSLYRLLKRVEVHLPQDWNRPITWEELTPQLAAHDTVLAIVNTRRHARELHAQMPEGTLHLSALMCGAHRSAVIADIKRRLRDSTPTRVISTQLVEAGVDIDFPVVYRALAGLDSIAQAAGRCNREGRMVTGQVVVFVPPEPPPPGLLRKGADASRSVLYGFAGDPLARDLFSSYFERLYYSCDLDVEHIADKLKVDGQTLAVNFRTAAERFRLIEDEDSVPVIVLYRGPDGTDARVESLIASLRKNGPKRWLMRALQRYTVNIHRREASRLQEQGGVEELAPGLFVQVSDWLYHPVLGLVTGDALPAGMQFVV